MWFLQHHLLVQLHTYITLNLGPNSIGCSLEDPLRVRDVGVDRMSENLSLFALIGNLYVTMKLTQPIPFL